MRHIVAAKLLIVVDGDALILRNSNTHPRWPLYNDLPGGTIEDSETVEQGLIREVKEETGIDITATIPKQLYAVLKTKNDVTILSNLFYVTLPIRPPVTMDYEHDQYHWVPVHEVKDVETSYQDGINFALRQNLLGD